MNNSSIPPQNLPEQVLADHLSNSVPEVSPTANFLNQLLENKYSSHEIEKYLQLADKPLTLMLKASSLSELIYELVNNRKLFPPNTSAELKSLLEKYVQHVEQLNEEKFKNASSQSAALPLQTETNRLVIGEKNLKILRALAFIHQAKEPQTSYLEDGFFSIAKTELLLSILISQVQLGHELNLDYLGMLSPEQIEELQAVANVHRLIENVRLKRGLEPVISSDQDIFTAWGFRKPVDFDALCAALFNLENLPKKTS